MIANVEMSPGRRVARQFIFQEVFATLYQRLGIDIATTQFTDLAGRPINLARASRSKRARRWKAASSGFSNFMETSRQSLSSIAR